MIKLQSNIMLWKSKTVYKLFIASGMLSMNIGSKCSNLSRYFVFKISSNSYTIRNNFTIHFSRINNIIINSESAETEKQICRQTGNYIIIKSYFVFHISVSNGGIRHKLIDILMQGGNFNHLLTINELLSTQTLLSFNFIIL